VDLQVSVDVGSVQKLRLGILLEKKLLVVLYFNGIICHIMFPGKFPLPLGYINIETRNFKRYVLSQSNV
jgi:hypothetical protein